MNKIFCMITAALLIGGCGETTSSGNPFSSRDGEWQAAMNAGDADAIAALYSEDARLMPPNQEAVTGRDAVKAALGAMIDSGANIELNTIETASSGDIAYSAGTFELTVGGEVVDRGKYVETWRRGDDGTWLMTNDIWNSDLAPGGDGGTHVVAVHDVEDFDRWIAAWRGESSRHEMFGAHGVAHAHTLQSRENPNLTAVILSVSDMEAFEAFMASDEAAQAAEADGVDLGETTIFVEVE